MPTATTFTDGYQSEPNVLMFFDACEHLADFMGSAAQDVEQRVVRRAVQNAYLRFTNERSWQYLYTPGRVNLVAPYSTGTLSFDFSGGTYERLVTFSTALSSAAQGWAKYGKLLIDGVVYEIEDYKSTTTVTLKFNSNPGADLAAGTTFTMYQNVYSLPGNFRRLCEPSTKNRWWSYYIQPKDWHWRERHIRSSADPQTWTIMSDPDRTGGYALYVDPYPSAAGTFDFIYQRHPRNITLTGFETAARVGTVTFQYLDTLAGFTTVLGSSTTFLSLPGDSAGLIGSYIRMSPDGTNVPGGRGSLYPYAQQRRIVGVTDSTHLTVDTAIDRVEGIGVGANISLAAVKYCITDPIDIPWNLTTAFLRCCEYQYSILGRASGMADSERLYRQELIRACENDSLCEVNRYMGRVADYVSRGWHDTPLGSNING